MRPQQAAPPALTCHFKCERAELPAAAHFGKSFEDGGCSSPLARQQSPPVPGGLPVTAQSCPCVDTRHSSAEPRPAAAGPPSLRDTRLKQEPFLTFTGKIGGVLEVSVGQMDCSGVLCPVYSLSSALGQWGCVPGLWKHGGLVEPCVVPSSGWQGRHTWAISTEPQLLTHHKLPEQSAKAPFDG